MERYHGIDSDEAAHLLARIVATPSVNPGFRGTDDPEELFGEARLAGVLAEWLGEAGIDTALDEVAPGRPNLVARVEGGASRPRMLWEGHLDTVQVTGMAAPFAPDQREGRLYGRGAVDDGGSLVAFMLALRALHATPPPGEVDFVAAMDEEYGHRGILHHLDRGEVYDLGVAGEPTRLRVVRACKGVVRWRVRLEGRAAHSSRPQEGLSTITAARALLRAYEAEMQRRHVVHELLGAPTLTCTGIEAGEGPNTVPASAVVSFDYRSLPAETGAEVHRDFAAVAREVAAQMPGLAVDVEPPFVDSPGMDVPADSTVVRDMAEVCSAAGLDSEPVGVSFGSDATKMTSLAAIPAVVFGPGNIEQAHTTDEYVEIAEVVRAARLLVDLAHCQRR